MRELSNVEVNEVSGGIFGGIISSLTQGAETVLGTFTNAARSVGKVFTDGVFNLVRGFWEGRYTK